MENAVITCLFYPSLEFSVTTMVKTGGLQANSVITSSMSVMVFRKGFFNLFILLKLGSAGYVNNVITAA